MGSSLYVYGLNDPDTKQTHYVGQARYPRQRLKQHMREAWEAYHYAPHRSPRIISQKHQWLRNVAMRGKWPELGVLEEVTSGDKGTALSRELRWTVNLGGLGHPITNFTIAWSVQRADEIENWPQYVVASPPSAPVSADLDYDLSWCGLCSKYFDWDELHYTHVYSCHPEAVYFDTSWDEWKDETAEPRLVKYRTYGRGWGGKRVQIYAADNDPRRVRILEHKLEIEEAFRREMGIA